MARRARLGWGLAAGVLLLAGGGGAYAWSRGPLVSTVPVERRDLEQRIVATGRVMAPARVNVSAITPGLVVAVGAVEGQRVNAGDLLLSVDDAEARAAVAQAKAAVEQASAKVEQLRRVGSIVASEQLSSAQSSYERAEKELGRATELAKAGALPQRELDEAQRALEVARAQRNAARVQQVAAAPSGADSRVALSGLMVAEAQLSGAEVRLAQTRVLAPRAGVILTREVEVGDVVQPGKTLLVLATEGEVELVFQPDERNLSSIAIGQKARASADAFPEQVFDAEVSFIAPSADPERGTIEVRLRVPEPPSVLRPDLTVSIDLLVREKPGALVAPSEAIRGLGTHAPWALVVEGGKLARRDVALGIRGDAKSEITEGLAEGDEVVVAAPISAVPGKRVRAERRDAP